ncbi:MAG: phosphoribosylamine--glycine ligase, partial [Thermodesulfovibrionales bacterium]
GPELPLSEGIVDAFVKEGLKIVGPCQDAARLESSKVFAKEFMKRHKIPTADYKVFTSFSMAEEYLRMKPLPIVIKADGLAAGKGVFIAKDIEEALNALRLILKDRIFGDAGKTVIIEQCLMGEEASFMVFTDGETIIPMVSSQDHKRVFDNDEGPNTGGMGAYSPAPVVTDHLQDRVMKDIIHPTIKGLRAEGITYKGILYAGLMICDGKPFVLEYNCRMGDPETQPVLMRLDSDLLDVSLGIANGNLQNCEVRWSDKSSVCVVLASGGYPDKYEKGLEIKGLDKVRGLNDVVVFHAGTDLKDDKIITSGGRVLGVTAIGDSIRSAQQRAYEAIGYIHFDKMHYRKDIANRALKKR